MKGIEKKITKGNYVIHYFIDETGSPEFYGKKNTLLVGQPGYSPILIIGLTSVIKRKAFHKRVERFKKELLNDPALKRIRSLHDPGWYLHAKDDHPKIRDRFFKFLSEQKNFRGYFIIGRKDINIFKKRHKSSEEGFYFDLIQSLLKDRFKDFKRIKIYLSRRSGNKVETFKNAIEASIEKYNVTTKKEDIKPEYSYAIVSSKEMIEFSIIDYLLWALQRYIIMRDDKYYQLLKDKYYYIYDIYDKKLLSTSKYYTSKNPFDLEKASKYK